MGVSSAVNSAANAIVNSMVSSAMIRNHVDPKDLKDPKMMTSISTLKTKRTLISTLETIRTLISTLKTTRTLISTLTLRTTSQQREERKKGSAKLIQKGGDKEDKEGDFDGFDGEDKEGDF